MGDIYRSPARLALALLDNMLRRDPARRVWIFPTKSMCHGFDSSFFSDMGPYLWRSPPVVEKFS